MEKSTMIFSASFHSYINLPEGNQFYDPKLHPNAREIHQLQQIILSLELGSRGVTIPWAVVKILDVKSNKHQERSLV